MGSSESSLCLWRAASGTRRMRVAPGLAETMVPPGSSTMTPAVRLSRMVCRLARADSVSLMLWFSAVRASASCCVMSAKERVRLTISSRPGSTSLGVRSPAATWRTPSASVSSGVANCLPIITASSTAPNTARNRLSVKVPMYMRRRPSRPSARSWYSRLACCTARALATRSTGSGCTAWITRCSSSRPSERPPMSASAFTRGPGVPGRTPATASSSPSICVTMPCRRTLRQAWVEGRSGLSSKRELPALAISRPLPALQSVASVAPSCSRSRSSGTAATASGVSARPAAAVRNWLPNSRAWASREVRARLRPESSAPSTRTSNHDSMERDTNWYDTP